MQFFKKIVTLKINIFALCTISILLIATIAAIRFHVPENLFFVLLKPSHVESVELRLPSCEGYARMTEQEIAATIAILNQIRVTDGAEHSIPPSAQAIAECKIHLKWGTTLYVSANTGRLGINAYSLFGNRQQAEDLGSLLRDLRQAKKES